MAVNGEASDSYFRSTVKMTHYRNTVEMRSRASTIGRVVRESTCFEPIGRGRYRLRYESFNARTSGAELQKPRSASARCK